MNKMYTALGLGAVILVGSIRFAVTFTSHLDEMGPAGAPFAHTRFCLRYPDDCKENSTKDKVKSVALSPQRRAELKSVNDDVNETIVAQPQNESVASENWLIDPVAGDCNDYAVTKRHVLIGKGWPADSLLLTEVALPSGEHHLVLIVRTSEGDLVLDNLKSEVRSVAEAAIDYKWVRMESKDNPKYWSKVRQPS